MFELAEIIASASGYSIFISGILILILWCCADKLLATAEKVLFKRTFLNVFDILNVGFWIVIFILVLREIGSK